MLAGVVSKYENRDGERERERDWEEGGVVKHTAAERIRYGLGEGDLFYLPFF